MRRDAAGGGDFPGEVLETAPGGRAPGGGSLYLPFLLSKVIEKMGDGPFGDSWQRPPKKSFRLTKPRIDAVKVEKRDG